MCRVCVCMYVEEEEEEEQVEDYVKDYIIKIHFGILLKSRVCCGG